VYFELVEIAHHQQRWVRQRLAIPLQLRVRRNEVLALPLVFPAEVVALPYVSEPVAIRVVAPFSNA
jgi:hypothetical protein